MKHVWLFRKPVGPCAWCGEPTDMLFEALGSRRPLHLLCNGAFVRALRKWRESQPLDDVESARLQGMVRR